MHCIYKADCLLSNFSSLWALRPTLSDSFVMFT